MNTLAIFGLQLIMSLILCSLLAKWFLAPWLNKQTQSQALFWLTLPHATRYIGMVFLVPGVVSPSLPTSFATAAAFGDLIAGILALIVLIALRNRWAGTMALVWLFNIIGTLDLLYALSHEQAVPHLGAAWYIPTFWVPVLLVTHSMIFARLLKKPTAQGIATGHPAL